jgi:hypothetical protein
VKRARSACATALLVATIAIGCSPRSPEATVAEASSASPAAQAATLSVTALRFSGWHDETFHYLPALSVTAPAGGRPVFVQRVDFTAEDAGTRRLLKGIRYDAPQRVQPGKTVELISDDAADRSEIPTPVALEAISAIVFFADDEGRTALVSAAAKVPDVPARASHASLVIRHFMVGRRSHHGRFLYSPRLTLAETSGRSHASVKKIVFELLDAGSATQPRVAWPARVVGAGEAITLDAGAHGQAQWFEFESGSDAPRVSAAVSYIDNAGRGGMVTGIATVERH